MSMGIILPLLSECVLYPLSHAGLSSAMQVCRLYEYRQKHVSNTYNQTRMRAHTHTHSHGVFAIV